MATFVLLVNWTDQGIRGVRETVERLAGAEELARKMGVEFKATYWTLGPYDLVDVIEAPDDETATAFALAMSAPGSIRTMTMRAFDRHEMAERVLPNLPG